jgi:hypothetical protein
VVTLVSGSVPFTGVVVRSGCENRSPELSEASPPVGWRSFGWPSVSKMSTFLGVGVRGVPASRAPRLLGVRPKRYFAAAFIGAARVVPWAESDFGVGLPMQSTPLTKALVPLNVPGAV